MASFSKKFLPFDDVVIIQTMDCCWADLLRTLAVEDNNIVTLSKKMI
jgi:hypothetical protein